MGKNKYWINIDQDKLKNVIKENINYYYDALLDDRKDNNLLDDFEYTLNEVRGVIDGLSQLILYLETKFNEIIHDEKLMNSYYIGYDSDELVYKYQFELTVDSNLVDTNFMINPKFTFIVFKSTNNYSDLKRELADSYYIGTTDPKIVIENNETKIMDAQFIISVNISVDLTYINNYFYGKLRHEITHCKRNMMEYIHDPQKLYNRYKNEILYNSLNDEDEINHLIKRCLYLINDDEINARSHQIYSELDEVSKNPFLTRLKQKIVRTDIYQNFISETDKYIKILEYNLTNKYLSEAIRNIVHINKKNNITYFLNKLIIAKNKQLSGFQKVAEQWQYNKIINKI